MKKIMESSQANCRRLTAFALVCCVTGSLWSNGLASNAKLSFDRDIRPILSENCFACHGFDAGARQADLRLDTRLGAVDDGGVIVPRDSANSVLIERIDATDEADQMPPPDSGKALTSLQKELLQRWINEGAEYEKHWAFETPVKTEPTVLDSMSHPIDRFIRARLAMAGLTPSPRASFATLIRRVSLDLIGLPPTPNQIAEFKVAAARDFRSAYRELVDRLLASPGYGERWGRWWLDQARYADSNGYSVDAPREIWLYRDWVVDALNSDMPFDQFTTEQLAGDLLTNASEAQRIATGFHRNTQINQEGGVDHEQFRIESIFDRVATTGTVWLGLSIGCAQCHNHKFDPLTQQEYYSFFAFLNNQDEPTIKVQRAGMPDAVETMVLAERSEPRKTHLMIKGDFTRPAQEVFPNTPAVLHPLQAETVLPTRLDLARWIAARENPLTARVIVNRIWQQYYGRGIVETENDFGLQGSLPSHPELLDWLAVEFRDSQWRMKNIHRLIVSSETYCQSSVVRLDLSEKDPLNVWLGRQNRLRLDAEVVRDVALVASGLFSPKMGGPPVFPPIPTGVMNQGQVKRTWNVSEGDDRYRRGLYTFVYRATPPPALNVFDAPDGLSSCTRRNRSNTPLQALTLLNDAAFFEFAQALKDRIMEEGLESAFERCTSRQPTHEELQLLNQLDSLNVARALLNLDETINRE